MKTVIFSFLTVGNTCIAIKLAAFTAVIHGHKVFLFPYRVKLMQG